MDNSKLKKRSLSQEDLFNFSELFKLMKPRVMSLVIFTCAVGLLTAPNIVSTKDAIIGMINHHGNIRVAHGTSVLSEDDIALVFAKPKAIGKLKKLFSA